MLWGEVYVNNCDSLRIARRYYSFYPLISIQLLPCTARLGNSSSSRNEYYLGGIIALLLQDHRTMSTKSVQPVDE